MVTLLNYILGNPCQCNVLDGARVVVVAGGGWWRGRRGGEGVSPSSYELESTNLTKNNAPIMLNGQLNARSTLLLPRKSVSPGPAYCAANEFHRNSPWNDFVRNVTELLFSWAVHLHGPACDWWQPKHFSWPHFPATLAPAEMQTRWLSWDERMSSPEIMRRDRTSWDTPRRTSHCGQKPVIGWDP